MKFILQKNVVIIMQKMIKLKWKKYLNKSKI